MSEKTKLTKEQLDGDPELTDQALAHVVGGAAPTTIGPTGAASVEPPKATTVAATPGTTNPGFTLDQFTITSSGLG